MHEPTESMKLVVLEVFDADDEGSLHRAFDPR